ncbi:ROK family protein [Streptomyces sp. CB02923]|uniref:ROK family transcriptional regulator n=1 Tax=Streptomyces sp. CB02923 TaxID=1718985 RepID=UPI00093F8C45|nr:ROK family transcriptional regulator [Streptomyces sp. CB02923]OKH99185.1 ROK family protein [Streptomyces sp. CB02923]
MNSAGPAADTQHGIRRRNLARVLGTVAAAGPMSRAGIAARVGLTRAAVSSLVDALLRAGLLVETGPAAPSGRGRPGSELSVSDTGPAGIGAEIGVGHLAVCAVDLRGRIRAREATDSVNRGSDPGAVLRRLAGMITEVTGRIAPLGLRPAGLTVAVPGLVARGTTIVAHAPNLGWRYVDPAPALRALTDAHCPLAVGNEAHLGALAEMRLGGGPDGHGAPPPDFLHISAEVGIGAAVVVGGQLLHGVRGFAGELGHVPVYPGGRPCGCGGRGCLEQYAGEAAVLRAAGLDPAQATAGRPGSRAGVELLARSAAAGDRAASAALRDAGTALGIALTGAVHLLDPQAVVLGGALARLAPWLLPPLERELTARTAVGPLAESAPRARVAVSRVGADGPLLGAAHAALRAVLDDPLGRSRTPAVLRQLSGE